MEQKRNDRRMNSRHDGGAVKRVKTTVQFEDGRSYDGQLDDVSISGAAARFAANTSPRLKLGQKIIITLRLPLPSRNYQVADVRAIVRHIGEENDSAFVRCGLQFEKRVTSGGALYRALRALANRRREPRLAPASDEAITMVLKTDDGLEINGQIRDISANGARVLVGGDFETDALGLDSIALSFQLPSEDHDTKLVGQVRNSRTNRDQTYVGVEFDEAGSPGFRAQQKEIVRYLMRRQREMLRKKDDHSSRE